MKFQIILLFILGLINCATFKKGLIESNPIMKENPEPIKKISSNVIVKTEYMLNGDSKGENKASVTEIWKNGIRRSLEETKLFSTTTQEKDADLILETKLIEDSKFLPFMPYLTGITLAIIPTWINTEFIMETTFKNKKGIIGTIKKSENVSFWIQILLILYMPFNKPTTSLESLPRDLSMATIEEAISKGYINSKPLK
jgi:hypothetical protein